jgi:hypothetical protein
MTKEMGAIRKKWILYHINSGAITLITDSIVIGREKLCDIVLPNNPEISRKSIIITSTNEHCDLEVVGKLPITFKKLTVKDQCKIFHKDRFKLSDHIFYILDKNDVHFDSLLEKLKLVNLKNPNKPKIKIKKPKWSLKPKFKIIYFLILLPSICLTTALAFIQMGSSFSFGLLMLASTLFALYITYTLLIHYSKLIKRKYRFNDLVFKVVTIIPTFLISIIITFSSFSLINTMIDFEKIWRSKCSNETINVRSRSHSCFKLGKSSYIESPSIQLELITKACELNHKKACEWLAEKKLKTTRPPTRTN